MSCSPEETRAGGRIIDRQQMDVSSVWEGGITRVGQIHFNAVKEIDGEINKQIPREG